MVSKGMYTKAMFCS